MKNFNLEIKDIKNLKLKLVGKSPLINKDELLALVNSWGRSESFKILNKNNKKREIAKCIENEKFDLSNLDVSRITNFDTIFAFSNFEGDINSWNVSNATSMDSMFYKNKNFNSPLDKWNVSKVTSMKFMFSDTKNFNQNLNSWDTSNVISMLYMFEKAKSFNQSILWNMSQIESCHAMFYNTAFEERFNNGKELPHETEKIKLWLKENRNKMIALDIEDNKSKDLDNFLLNFNKKDIYDKNI